MTLSCRRLSFVTFAAVLFSATFSQLSIHSVAASDAATLFVDATSASGILQRHSAAPGLSFGTGAAWLDYNNDGHVDLYVTRGSGANALYRNLGDGRFVDVAESAAARDALNAGAGVAVADFDNDGWRDIYLANSGADVLLRNVNGERFVDITAAAGLAEQGRGAGQSASWGDYNSDGLLDLYVANHRYAPGATTENQDKLFVNNGNSSFSDVSHLLGTHNLEGYGFIGAWTDYDNDGDLDIFLVNDCPYGPLPIRIFRNDGGTDAHHWRFSEVSASLGVDDCAAGMGLAIGDYNRDGSLDYFYTSIGQPYLLQNRSGVLSNATAAAGIYQKGKYLASGNLRVTWGANFVDYDLDGWLDLYVCSGAMYADQENQENLLFRNNGDGRTFSDVTPTSGAADPRRSRTSVASDYDADGDVDLFVVNYDAPPTLCRNTNRNANAYIRIELEGVTSNRDGIGAKVRIKTADGFQFAEVHSGISLGGGDDLALHFGLGDATHVEEVHIQWPSGVDQFVSGIAANQRLKIRESPAPSSPQNVATRLLQNFPNPFNPSTTIRYDIAAAGQAEVTVFNVRGELVKRLEARYHLPGSYETSWAGDNSTGDPVPSGIYFYQLRDTGATQTRKMVLLK